MTGLAAKSINLKSDAVKIALIRLICALLLSVSALTSASNSMDKVLETVQQALQQHQTMEEQRLAGFSKKNQDRQSQLAALREKIALEQERQQQLQLKFNALNEQNAVKSQQLQQRSEQLSALFAFAKKYAGETAEKRGVGFALARFPDDQQALTFANSSAVPQLQDLKNLWLILMQEMTAHAGVSRFDGKVINEKGQTVVSQVMQIGAFNAIDSQGNYLVQYAGAGSDQLQVLQGVSEALKQQAKAYFNGTSSQLIIDPLKGQILDRQSRSPSLLQRVEQGGIVGYIILALGALGLLISLWRVLYISWVGSSIRRQQKSNQLTINNPLGRVLKAIEQARSAERAELLMDQALLTEIPKLERCHSLVKLLAAVAPLLGLLGTVTGMIETFQSITLLGTSDPKLMAGGISQALITTVMGLCAAIPLLFCHSFISAKSQALLQLIQQQSLGLLSEFGVGSQRVSAVNSSKDDLASDSAQSNRTQLRLEGAALV